MTAVLYYMHISEHDSLVGEYATSDLWPNPATGMVVRSATFSSEAGDSPQVLTPRGKPDVNSTFTSEGVYTPANAEQFYRIKPEWSGGTDRGGYYEFSPDGSAQLTLTLTKIDSETEAPVGSGTESFQLCPGGIPVNANAGMISLVGGVGSFVLTPPATSKGRSAIAVMNDGHQVPLQERVKDVLFT